MELAPISHAIVEAAKALWGSFKLVTLTPKNCKGDDSTAQGGKMGTHKQIKETQMNTQNRKLV